MDKRSFLFITIITLAFFLTQHFFFSNKKNTTTQTTVNKVENEKQLVSEKKSNYFAKIYLTETLDNQITNSIRSQNSIFAFAWSKDLPEKIFDENSDEFYLKSKNFKVNDLVLYQKDEDSNIFLPDIANLKKVELKIVSLNNNFSPLVGYFQDGYFSLPLNHNYKNSIALINQEDFYLPVAVFDEKESQFKSLKNLKDFSTIIKTSTGSVSNNQDESFYLLENEYQQIVFSNVGGSIAEINLTFKSGKNKTSLINPIEADRIIAKNNPEQDHFPLNSYYSYDNEFHEKGVLGGYYPLLRRNLKGFKIAPKYYAFNILSDTEKNLEKVKYQLKHFDKNSITFEALFSNRKIIKTYKLGKGPFCLEATVNVEGNSDNLWITSGVPEVELITGQFVPSIKYRINRGEKVVIEKTKLPKTATTVSSIYPDWVSNSNGFFGLIIDPLTDIEPGYRALHIDGKEIPTRYTLIDKEFNKYPAEKYPGYELYLPIKSSESRFRLFSGPYQKDLLKEVDKIYSDPLKGYNPDYDAVRSFHGFFSFISEPFAKFLFLLMKFFHNVSGSWGISIILLTIALRVMLYPLNAWSIKSSLRMQELSPKIQAIQSKYKNNKKQAQIETMKLYRSGGANPLSGCLPIVIQMPFLFGMFDLLKSSFDLRGASFIPGWINNLTAPDVLFSWNMPIFFVGNQFHLLPLIMALVMFVQQKMMNPNAMKKSEMTDQQKQQQMMGSIVPFIFLILFYRMPSGLNIYFLFSTLLGILQQWLMSLKKKKEPQLKVIK